MLSRIADSLFWIGRYLERAEDTCRIVEVHLHQRLDDPGAYPAQAARDLILLMGQEPASDDPDVLSDHLHRFALIAVRFPSFTDGRGYSIARRLREGHGWSGALMAVGDVLRDQLLLLEHCGFDTFSLREDQDLDASLSAFADFSAFEALRLRVW